MKAFYVSRETSPNYSWAILDPNSPMLSRNRDLESSIAVKTNSHYDTNDLPCFCRFLNWFLWKDVEVVFLLQLEMPVTRQNLCYLGLKCYIGCPGSCLMCVLPTRLVRTSWRQQRGHERNMERTFHGHGLLLCWILCDVSSWIRNSARGNTMTA